MHRGSSLCIYIGVSVITCATAVVTALDAQAIPMTPAARRALVDTSLVHQVPGRFITKASNADVRVSDAQRATMRAQLASLIALLRRDPSLNPPPRADAVVTPDIDVNDNPGDAQIIAGAINVIVWPYAVAGGHVGMNNGQYQASGTLFRIRANQPMCTPTDEAGSGLGFALAPKQTGRFHGYPTLDSIVVITHRTRPPCIPVTREQVLTALLNKVARSASSSDTDSEARAAKRDQDAALRDMAKADPRGAAQLRVQIAQGQQVADSISNSLGAGFRNALARLSPAERASPAFLSENGCPDESNGCLVDANAVGARMVVRSNPAFFDSSHPADVQLITFDIRHVFDDTSPSNPYLVALMHSIMDQLDWPALGALVR